MLAVKELARRIEAAQILRAPTGKTRLSLADLGKAFVADGFGKTDPSRLKRGQMDLTRSRREALARHLRVPERWFTAETVDEIVGYGRKDAGADGSADAISRERAKVLRDELRILASLVEDLLGQPGPDTERRAPRSPPAADRREEPPQDAASGNPQT